MNTDLTHAQQSQRARYLLRTILFFWPMVDSPDDVDRVTRFGYHVCMGALAYTAFTLVPDLVNMDWIAWATLALFAVLYFLAANAIRQASVTVATALCLLLATDIPYAYLLNRKFPWQACVTLLAFIIVWRGIVLAARFAGSPTWEPSHLSDTLAPRSRFRLGRYLMDALPVRLWPASQPAFWMAAATLLGCEAYFSYAYVQMHR